MRSALFFHCLLAPASLNYVLRFLKKHLLSAHPSMQTKIKLLFVSCHKLIDLGGLFRFKSPKRGNIGMNLKSL